MKAETSKRHLLDLLASGAGHVHLLGACGVGMAGLAVLLRQRGFVVSGCDQALNPLSAWLGQNGVEVSEGHDPNHLDAGVNWLVRSAAISDSLPELDRAHALELPVFSRGEVLPALLAGRTSVAVAGTHGKTTTASFVLQLLRAAGRDPAWCIGGETPGVDGVSGDGTDAIIVVEADESDGSLADYEVDLAVITNIESDHLEHFGDDTAVDRCFQEFAQKARLVIYGMDDPRARSVCASLPDARSFGMSEGADIRAHELRAGDPGTEWTLVADGIVETLCSPDVTGSHNISNALAAAATGLALGLRADEIKQGLSSLKLPRRRFDVLSDQAGVVVINDYAHHPSEIAALIGAAKCIPHERLVAVFQPHRYSRTLALRDAYPSAFEGLDELLLLPVYAASESPVQGGATWDLYSSFRSSPGACTPRVAESLDEAWAYLRATLRKGDVLLVVGAGDVEQLAYTAAEALTTAGDVSRLEPAIRQDALTLSEASALRIHEPLSDKTTLQLGGTADVWIDVGCVADFEAVLAWTHTTGLPLTLIAGGSNVLISDLGVRGVTVQLSGKEFFVLEKRDDLAVVGSAVPVKMMLDWMEAEGLHGLEFMESIPGTLGGGMQMNAGAWGHCLGDSLAWVRCLDRQGEVRTVERDALDLGYRRCEFLKSRYVIEAAFHVRAGDPAVIAAERSDIRERRQWMSGHRSAGSFFKNPQGEKAGRLLEAVGMHGRRVGGAVIGTHHANFVIVENGATSADVRALTQQGLSAVAEKFDVQLEPEVKYLT